MKTTLCLTLLATASLQAEPLVVHEWGTFTVLQDENGDGVPGINIDDEPVPYFVHRIGNLIRSVGSARQAPATATVAGFEVAMKSGSLPTCHPDVRMRLETPVIYFYPPGGQEMVVDVEVKFPGGWISEYYPDAEVSAPGFEQRRIPESESGWLAWKNLQIGGRADGPKTNAAVWLIPRAVDAASVRTPAGESERYLFYRGVANLDAPVRVRREGGMLRLVGETRAAWLTDFRSDGTVAFCRARDQMPGEFTGHSRNNVAQLKKEMLDELITEGLFPKEAEAMLKTWEDSYFGSAGLRLFYIVPRKWTDEHLPLKISADAQITRAMIGRIELVAPDQRRTLERLVKMESVDSTNLPGGYYLLGRFGNALLAQEHRDRPTSGTERWVNALSLGQN